MYFDMIASIPIKANKQRERKRDLEQQQQYQHTRVSGTLLSSQRKQKCLYKTMSLGGHTHSNKQTYLKMKERKAINPTREHIISQPKLLFVQDTILQRDNIITPNTSFHGANIHLIILRCPIHTLHILGLGIPILVESAIGLNLALGPQILLQRNIFLRIHGIIDLILEPIRRRIQQASSRARIAGGVQYRFGRVRCRCRPRRGTSQRQVHPLRVHRTSLANVREGLHGPLDPDIRPSDHGLGITPLGALKLALLLRGGSIRISYIHLAQILAMSPHLIDLLGIIPVEGELPPQIQLILIAESIGDNVIIRPLLLRHPARHVAEYHVDIGVSPMRIIGEVVGEDVSKGGLVFDEYVRQAEELRGERRYQVVQRHLHDVGPLSLVGDAGE